MRVRSKSTKLQRKIEQLTHDEEKHVPVLANATNWYL
jgi:hypothetical protein